MDLFEFIDKYEQNFLALRKLAEDGLDQCHDMRLLARSEGLTPKSANIDQSQKEFEAALKAKFLAKAEKKKLKQLQRA